jgi:hypothetical protein
MVKYGDVFQQIQERIDSDLDEVVEDLKMSTFWFW